ncbi:hypothetical protein [Thermostaphylospora chromogena]|nr:hypothetical protein [Thermostaphylospora chromogena]
MSMPFQSTPCTRCGQPVQPDPQAHGMWVDRWNGRYCGGDQRFPHQVPNAAGPLPPHQPPGTTIPLPPHQAPNAAAPFPTPPVPHAAPAKRTTAVWVVAGSALAVIVLIAVVAGVFLLRPGPGKPTAAGTSERTSHPTLPEQTASWAETEQTTAEPTRSEQTTAEPTQSGQAAAEQTAPPGAPVPCDPQRPSGHRCFPSTITGAELLERIRKEENWTCYRKGEKNRAGRKVSHPECESVTTDKRTYMKTAAIWYENREEQEDGPLQKVGISVSTTGVDDGLTAQETTAFASRTFDTALTHLWPDNEQLRTETKEAFEKVNAVCAEIINAEPVRTPSGYLVSCFPPITTPTVDREGTPITVRTYTFEIRAPYSFEMPYTG